MRRLTCGYAMSVSRPSDSRALVPVTISGRWETPVPAVPAVKSSMIMGRRSPVGHLDRLMQTVTAMLRSGIWCLCSTTVIPAVKIPLYPNLRWIPGWVWNGWQRFSRVYTVITRLIFSSHSFRHRPRSWAPTIQIIIHSKSLRTISVRPLFSLLTV